ncbi:unnamed protein product [Candida verbasci]|uniref:Major facilitator superfamily (MFS) profile domain-containing protein n=1 Tax=Candida verbasci TaxID=1227364 RepID=A0A9W4TX73_9ASCO|nr:unnamed protein product [Candida verbasci]
MTSLVNVEEDPLIETAAQDVYQAIVDDETESEDEDITWFREHIASNKNKHWLKRPSVYSIGFVNFLLMTSMAATAPTLQIIIFKLSCNSLIDSKGICDPIQTQVLVSNLSMFKEVGCVLISLIPVAKIGELSDIYGRKPFLFFALLVLTISKIFEYFIYKHSNELKFWLFLSANYISAISGGSFVIVSLINSYISDIVESHERIYALGLAGSSLYLGQSIGPILGNFILKIGNQFEQPQKSIHINAITELSKISNSEFVLLKFEIIIYIILVIYLGTVFPESRNEKARRKSRANSITSTQQRKSQSQSIWNVFSPLKILLYPSELATASSKSKISKIRFVVISIILSSCLYSALMLAIGQVLVQYGILKFDWGTSEIAYLMTITAVSKCIVLIFLLPFFQNTVLKKWCDLKTLKNQFDMIDFVLILFGYTVDLIVFISFYFINSTNGFMISFGLFSLGAITGPTTNSALLKFYPNSKIGVVFGANALLLNFVSILAPILIMNLYKASLDFNWSNFIFLIYSVFLGFIILMTIMIKRVLKLNRFSNKSDFSETNII